MSRNCEVRGTITTETELAMLLHHEESGEDVWLPFSEIEAIHRHPDHAVIEIPRWLAAERGLL